MTAVSGYLGKALLDHTLRNVPYTSPGTSVYVSAYLSDPQDDDSGTEVPSLYAYARVQVASWEVVINNITRNTVNISFPDASGGDWGIITHLAIHDAATLGNLLFRGPLGAPVTISDADQLVIGAQNCQVGIT